MSRKWAVELRNLLFWQLIFYWFSTTFIHFHLFLTVFTYSLSILLIFDCLYLFSTVLNQIQVFTWRLIFTFFLCHFSFIFIHFCYIWQNSFTSLAMFSNRVRLGRPRVRPCRVKSDNLALDPMRARPGHEKSGQTLALPTDSVLEHLSKVAPQSSMESGQVIGHEGHPFSQSQQMGRKHHPHHQQSKKKL